MRINTKTELVVCGISGIVSQNTVDENSISLINHALIHRGPNAQHTFMNESGSIAMGHTRLSIIDLRESANQPFHSANGRYVIVFNGEIYNFLNLKRELADSYSCVFKTTSDTEVIAEAFSIWGKETVSKLEGMFAIAILDKQTNRVHLFRDRIGKKPLFYFQSDKLFAFASEIKALLKHPVVKKEVKINYKIISTFLHLGYIPEPYTIFDNIHKFPSGHYGEIDERLDLKLACYWKIDDKISSKNIRTDDPASQLQNLLDDAVTKRLISDVPLGAFLSGGTDSSLVSAIASKYLSKPLKTFSIGFAESKFDESRYAREVAQKLSTEHTEYILSEKEAVSLLETYVTHFDEPFADTSAIPTMLVSQLARKDVTVALTGDGGDELFQGYGAYTWANRLSRPLFKLMKGPLRTGLTLTGTSRMQRVAHMLESIEPAQVRSHIFSQEQYFFSQREIQEQLLVNADDFIPFTYNDLAIGDRDLTAGEKQAVFDLQFYLKDDLLVKVDRASMYSALECRSPLLDHRVVEFAFSLDNHYKIRDGKSKWVLKELLRKYLPDHLVDRQKWGFSVPLSRWLKSDLRYLIDSFLNEEVIEDLGLFKTSYINQLTKDFFDGKDYLYNRLWVLIILHKWLKEHR